MRSGIIFGKNYMGWRGVVYAAVNITKV
jgi:hypothetical protein